MIDLGMRGQVLYVTGGGPGIGRIPGGAGAVLLGGREAATAAADDQDGNFDVSHGHF